MSEPNSKRPRTDNVGKQLFLLEEQQQQQRPIDKPDGATGSSYSSNNTDNDDDDEPVFTVPFYKVSEKAVARAGISGPPATARSTAQSNSSPSTPLTTHSRKATAATATGGAPIHALMMMPTTAGSDTPSLQQQQRSPGPRQYFVSTPNKSTYYHPRHSPSRTPNNTATATTTNNSSRKVNVPSNSPDLFVTSIPEDPLVRSDSILNSVELELAWLCEESMYCCGCTDMQWDFIYQYASETLKMQLRKYSQWEQSKLLQSIIRMNDIVVSERWGYAREQIRLALGQGVRRPLMAHVIATVRLQGRDQKTTRRFPSLDSSVVASVAAVNEAAAELLLTSKPHATSKHHGASVVTGKPIEAVDPNTLQVVQVYPSIRKAGEMTGVAYTTLRKILKRQGNPIAGGLFWRLVGEHHGPWEWAEKAANGHSRGLHDSSHSKIDGVARGDFHDSMDDESSASSDDLPILSLKAQTQSNGRYVPSSSPGLARQGSHPAEDDSDEHLSAETTLWTEDAIVTRADSKVTGEFFLLLLNQFRLCNFGPEDRANQNKNIPIGYPGLLCRHCVGDVKGRLFFVRREALLDNAKSKNLLYDHIADCPRCPLIISNRLKLLRGDSQQFGVLNILKLVWQRMPVLDQSSPVVPAKSLPAKSLPSSSAENKLKDHSQQQRLESSRTNGAKEGPNADNSVVTSADRDVGDDFSLLLLQQFYPCKFRDSDKDGSNKQDLVNRQTKLRDGFPGLECIHCAGCDGNEDGRFFFMLKKNAVEAVDALFKHIRKCPFCPPDRLEKLKASSERQLNTANQAILMERVWYRLFKSR